MGFVEPVRQWWNANADPWIGRHFPNRTIWNNAVETWLLALAVLAGGFILLRLVVGLIRLRAGGIARRTQSDWARGLSDLLDAIRWWFLLAVAFFVASQVLVLNDRAVDVVRSAVKVLLVLQGAICGVLVIRFALERYAERRRETDPASVTMMSALAFLGRVTLWAVAALLVLQNAGVNVTALIAGLGIGGAAVALASQHILSDLFASLSIVLDKPFVLGDFLVLGDFMGSVEQIGLRTTRLRSLTGEQIIFSNNDLLQSRIRNYRSMRQRRVAFTIGVAYTTPVEKVRALPGLIREIIQSQQPVQFQVAHFLKYGDSALLFEVVYVVLSADDTLYRDIQQAINLALLERFAQAGIEFAFPTQTVYLHRNEPAE